MSWNKLSMAERANIMKLAVESGIYNLDTIRSAYNEFAEGGDTNPYTVGATVDALYASNPREEFLGEPSHHYDFTQSDEWADAHGYYPDARGHRDDRVKKPAHPSHPSRGTWNGDKFELTDFGMQNINYTLFGLNDGGQDPQAILTYQGGVALPEITVTPKENYIFNPYDNINIHLKSEGGKIHIKPENRGKFTALKERTGHSATWFKEHGTPAQKKMAIFALNARKWKHADGGLLLNTTNTFAGGGEKPGYNRQGTDHPIGIDASGNVYDQVTGEGGPIVLDEVTISPEYAYLNTWRPLVDGKYKLTGHSMLRTDSPAHIITNRPSSDDYNLLTNNCSDATRRALEKISGKRINPFLFTTPGDVKDFAENELGGITTYNDKRGHYVTKIPINQKQKAALLDLTEEGYEPSPEEIQKSVLQVGRLAGLVEQAMHDAAIGYYDYYPEDLPGHESYNVDTYPFKRRSRIEWHSLGGPLVERANSYPIGGPLTNVLASVRRAVNGSVIAASKAVINNSLNNMYQNTVGKYVFGNSSTEKPAANGALVGAKSGVPTTQVVNPDYTDLVDFLTADRNEGFLAEPTDIGDGKITIGSGLTNKKWLDLYKQRGNVWSKEDNRAAVLEEIKERSARLAKSLPNFNTLPLDSQKALISYDYNVGMSPNNHPNLWKAAKNKDWGTVANEMNATSKNPNFVKGLERRRKEEQDWFRRGFKAYGGNLYNDGGSSKGNHSQQMNQPNIFRRNGEYFYQASPDSEEITVTPVNTLFDDPALWTYTDNNGRLYTPRKAVPYTQGTITKKEDEGPLVEAAKNYLGELQYDINNGIPIGGKYTMPAIAASALLPLAGEAFAGTSIAGIPATTWADAALTAGFGAHGLNHLFNEGINGYGDAAMTALEIAPLGRLVRPMWNTTKNNARAFYNNLTMDLTSTPGTYYVGYPERDLSTLMPGKTGGIFLTPDKKFARGYTGAFGTGKVYETKVNFGENPIHIDAKGRHFDEIAEQDVLDAFNTTVEEMKELGLKPFYTKKGLFSKKPPQRYYHIDDVSAFGKKKGASSLIVDNVFDQGPGIFGFGTKGVGQQVVVYSPKQISLLKESHPVKSVPQITAENAASMTPEQWTAAQDAAIARGDMAEAQRLRDLHFKVSAPNTVASVNGQPLQLYHGTDATFNAFDISKYGSTDGGTFGRGVYTTPVKEYAKLYGKNNMPLYMKLDNPRDYRNFSISDLMAEKFAFGDDFATGNGIDGVIGRPSWKGFKGLEELVSHNPKNIKSSLPVTYADDGTRIPLGERDNFNINDIRYGLIPFLGLGAAGTLYGTSDK